MMYNLVIVYMLPLNQ